MTNETTQAVGAPLKRGVRPLVEKGARLEPRRFIAIATKTQAQKAGEMAEEIKAAIYKHANTVPLALAIGVLRIVERELMDDNA